MLKDLGRAALNCVRGKERNMHRYFSVLNTTDTTTTVCEGMGEQTPENHSLMLPLVNSVKMSERGRGGRVGKIN